MKNKIGKVVKSEIFLYAVFGVLTSILNVVMFYLLHLVMPYQVANFITLVVVKLVAYYCNKTFVFKSKCKNTKELMQEFLSFFIARGLTFLLDYFGLILLVECFHIDHTIGKVIVTVLVIIINYITGKKYVFKKRET